MRSDDLIPRSDESIMRSGATIIGNENLIRRSDDSTTDKVKRILRTTQLAGALGDLAGWSTAMVLTFRLRFSGLSSVFCCVGGRYQWIG